MTTAMDNRRKRSSRKRLSTVKSDDVDMKASGTESVDSLPNTMFSVQRGDKHFHCKLSLPSITEWCVVLYRRFNYGTVGNNHLVFVYDKQKSVDTKVEKMSSF
jgi:hypothetical protein